MPKGRKIEVANSKYGHDDFVLETLKIEGGRSCARNEATFDWKYSGCLGQPSDTATLVCATYRIDRAQVPLVKAICGSMRAP